MRVATGLTQAQLAKALGLRSQSAVARLEDPAYGAWSLSTLYKISDFFDVALITKFAPFSAFLRQVPSASQDDLSPRDFEQEDAEGLIESSDQTSSKSEPPGAFTINIFLSAPIGISTFSGAIPSAQKATQALELVEDLYQPGSFIIPNSELRLIENAA